MAAPTAVLEAAISQLASNEEPSTLPKFVPAKRFAGAKPGYVFTTGPEGVGYYRDSKQAAPAHAPDADEAPQPRRRLPTAEELLEAAEQQATEQVQLLDSKSLKRLMLQLERKTKDNLAARLKHADQPEKFMDSEVDLCAALDAYKILSATPELYSEFVNQGGAEAFVTLLSHENNDIVGQVTELLRDMTDDDAVEDQVEDARPLVAALVEHGAPQLLVQRLAGLDEGQEEEEGAVGNILSLCGNMVEIDERVAEALWQHTKLFHWLLNRIRAASFSPNKQEAAELLAVLAQSGATYQAALGKPEHLDAVLEALAAYKSRDPATELEEEFVDNLFDVVCAALVADANKPQFVESEGVELMLLMLKNKRYARGGAFKTLDFACTRCRVACERLVDRGGLRHVFPWFMGKSRSKGRRDEEGEGDEVRSLSLICSLLQCLDKGSRRDRVLAKFVENEFEKADRLMEIYDSVASRVGAEEARLEEEMGDEEVDEDELLLARMDAGLFALQQCCQVVGTLWQTGDVGVRRRVLTALHQRGETLAAVRSVLIELWHTLGSDGVWMCRVHDEVDHMCAADGQEAQEAQRGRVWSMVAALGGPVRLRVNFLSYMMRQHALQAEPPAEEEEAANGHDADGKRRRADEDLEEGDAKRTKATHE